MKYSFKINSKRLKDALRIVLPAIPQRSAIMAFEYAHVTVKDGDLLIKGSDGYSTVITKTSASETSGNFTLMLPAYQIVKLLSEMPDQEIEATLDVSEESMYSARKLHIDTTASGSYIFEVESADNFPSIKVGETKKFIVDGSEFSRAMHMCASLIDQKSVNPALTCVNIRSIGDEMQIVGAKDVSFILYNVKGNSGGNEFNFNLMYDAARILADFCDKLGDIAIHVSDSYVAVADDITKIICKSADLEYPDIPRITNGFRFEIETHFETGDILAAIRRTEALVDKSVETPIVVFDIRNDYAILEYINGMGEVLSTQNISCDSTGTIRFGLNMSVFKHLLNKHDGEVALHSLNNRSPIKIKFTNDLGITKYISPFAISNE